MVESAEVWQLHPPIHCMVLYFENIRDSIERKEDRYLLQILFEACKKKKTAAQMWCKAEIYTRQMEIVKETCDMEHLTTFN